MLARSGSGGTFFEVWDPQNEKLSPYGSYHMNSYCHAWSCTAAWFIREHQLGIKP